MQGCRLTPADGSFLNAQVRHQIMLLLMVLVKTRASMLQLPMAQGERRQVRMA